MNVQWNYLSQFGALLICISTPPAPAAVDIRQVMDPQKIVTDYRLPSDSYSSIEQLLAAIPPMKSQLESVNRKTNIVKVDDQGDIHGIWEGQLLYFSRPFVDVVAAFDPLASQPYPAPLLNADKTNLESPSPDYTIQYFQAYTHQEKSGITIDTTCPAATHKRLLANNHVQYQSALANCYDIKSKDKLWFREAWLTFDIVGLSPNLTGVLLRNIIVTKQNKVGPIKIPLSKYLESNIETSDSALKTISERLGITK